MTSATNLQHKAIELARQGAQALKDSVHLAEEANRGRMRCGGRVCEIVVLSVTAVIATLAALVAFGVLNLGTFGLPLLIAGAVSVAVFVGVAIRMISDACKNKAAENRVAQAITDFTAEHTLLESQVVSVSLRRFLRPIPEQLTALQEYRAHVNNPHVRPAHA